MDAKRRNRSYGTPVKGWQVALGAIMVALLLTVIAVLGARAMDEEDGPGGADEAQVEPGDRRT